MVVRKFKGENMILSTEIFVMIISFIGLPLFYGMVYSSKMPGTRFFWYAYFALLLSNTFTVIEEYWYYDLFNTLEHVMIIFGSVFIFIAVLRLTTVDAKKESDSFSNTDGE